MSKNIKTLVEDINNVIEGKGGWDDTVQEFFLSDLGQVMVDRLHERDKRDHPKGTLRMSSMGTPCKRKIWYSINKPELHEEFRASTLLKFLYGDILESLLLSLAMAAGHKVEGMQDECSIEGIKGHRDAVIDGVVVDVKSASQWSFEKFKDGELKSKGKDSFGYISQLSSYVHAAKGDPLVTDKTGGAFLVIDKVTGSLCLDYYDLSEEIKRKDQEFLDIKYMTMQLDPPDRLDDEPDGYTKAGEFRANGNRKLCLNCGYCWYKTTCFPSLRTFVGKGKPKYLTRVVKEPKMYEVE